MIRSRPFVATIAILAALGCGGRALGPDSGAGTLIGASQTGTMDVSDAIPSSPAGSGSAGATAGSSGAEAFCSGGCLCFSTPETCPSDCTKAHRSDGTFVCGYACDGPNVPCNCVYHPDDGGIYVCDSFTMPACPAVAPQQCDSFGGGCMTCGGPLGPAECGCSGPFPGDAGYVWTCIGTEETCKGP